MQKGVLILLLGFMMLPFHGHTQVDYKLDSSILESDYLILGRVLSDTSWAPPTGISGRWHAIDVLIVRQCTANWKTVQEEELRAVGDTMHQMKYFTENGQSMAIDSVYFMPIRIRGHFYVFFKDNPLDLAVVKDTSLFTEYCFRQNPSQHISFPIYEVQHLGKWKRTFQYTSDSILVSITDSRHLPGMPAKDITRYREYNADGKLLQRSRERTKKWAIGTKWVKWTFRKNGRVCLRRSADHSNWCN